MIENANKQKQNVGNRRISSHLGPPSTCFHSLFVIGFAPEKYIMDTVKTKSLQILQCKYTRVVLNLKQDYSYDL